VRVLGDLGALGFLPTDAQSPDSVSAVIHKGINRLSGNSIAAAKGTGRAPVA